MLGVVLVVASIQAIALQQETEPMGFFITSVGPGNGADLGGLAGADAHCQKLAEAVGAGNRTWRAYLSTQASGGQPAVNARDRIGNGPWANAKGLIIGANVDELHYNNGAINYEHARNEKGEQVNSGTSGDSPNMHDILTGTQLDGTAFPPPPCTLFKARIVSGMLARRGAPTNAWCRVPSFEAVQDARARCTLDSAILHSDLNLSVMGSLVLSLDSR